MYNPLMQDTKMLHQGIKLCLKKQERRKGAGEIFTSL